MERSRLRESSLEDEMKGLGTWITRMQQLPNKSLLIIGEDHTGGNTKEEKQESLGKQMAILERVRNECGGKRLAVISEMTQLDWKGLDLIGSFNNSKRPTLFYIKPFVDRIAPGAFKLSSITISQRTPGFNIKEDELYFSEYLTLLETHDIVVCIIGLAHMYGLNWISSQYNAQKPDKINYHLMNSACLSGTIKARDQLQYFQPNRDITSFYNEVCPYFNGSTLREKARLFIESIPVRNKTENDIRKQREYQMELLQQMSPETIAQLRSHSMGRASPAASVAKPFSVGSHITLRSNAKVKGVI